MPDTLPNPNLVAALPRYARLLTGDVHRADDLVQDTLARAWDKRHLWRAGSDLRPWLFAIMHNVHINQFSLRQRERAYVSLDADDGPVSLGTSQWVRLVRAPDSRHSRRYKVESGGLLIRTWRKLNPPRRGARAWEH